MRALARESKGRAVIYRTSVIYLSIPFVPRSCLDLAVSFFMLSHKAFTALFIIMPFPSNYMSTRMSKRTAKVCRKGGRELEMERRFDELLLCRSFGPLVFLLCLRR